MFDVPDDRHFGNEFPSWGSKETSTFKYDSDDKQHLTKFILAILRCYESDLSDVGKSNTSMYTGLAGIGYFYYHLSKVGSPLFSSDVIHHAAKKASEIFEACLCQRDSINFAKNISVFTSFTGVLLLGALLPPDTGGRPARSSSDSAHSPEGCLKQLLDAHVYALDLNSDMPDEALYGRVGYLSALLTAKEANLPIPDDVVSKVACAVIQSGVNNAANHHLSSHYQKLLERSNPRALPLPPLLYEWHDKAYLGAAHGFAGILLTLLKVHLLFPQIISSKKIEGLILPTVEWFSLLQLPSGNWPSSLGKRSDEDVLVHWCHGATGAIHLLLTAYKLTGKENYIQKALRAGECIWTRGLLYKGCGLCHGSAGSGYAHLTLYQVTQDRMHLYRTVKFAEWCTEYKRHRTRVPDRPLSLFEGLAGTLFYLVDVLDPVHARFPLLSGV